MNNLKRKLILTLCLFLAIGMAPMAVYAYPGDGGNVLEHMYTDKDLTYEENATVFIYATPGACEIVDEGGSYTYQRYRVTNFEGWYFEGWKTWYTGREYHWIFPDANEVNKENPKYDNGTAWYFSKYGISQQAYTANTYDYMKERIQVNKEGGYRGTYYLYAIFRPVLTVNAGDGITYKVSGASQITKDSGDVIDNQHAVAYNSAATVTYTVDPAYEVTGVSASYGTSHSVSGQTITVSNMVRPGSISINTEKKHMHDYSSDWSKDDSKHWRKCSCGEVTDEGEHIGGTATCNSQAVCTVCSKSYGLVDKANHSGGTEVKGYIAVTEFSNGYTGDTYCKGCQTMLKKGETVPATHQHSYSSNWSTDEATHWHECICGAKTDAAGHTFADATCTEPMTCTVCGLVTGEPAGHDYKDGICQTCGKKDPDYVPPNDPTDPSEPVGPTDPTDPTGPVDPSEPTDPAEPGDPGNAENPKDKSQVIDKDASPATGDDRSTTIYWILLVVAFLVIRRIIKRR